jgi:alcohol dehydrogenase
MAVAPQAVRRKVLPKGLMRATVFHAPSHFGLEEKALPHAGPGDVIVRVRLTSICGTDLHIVQGEFPVKAGLTLGHEGVGVVHEIGHCVTGYTVGQRVLVSAITPCGQCEPCLSGQLSQCGGPFGAWRLGHTMDGMQADYVRVPFAQANLTPIPDQLSDESVLLLSDVASTGFAAAEHGSVGLADTVAVFAQGPVGLCATLGAKLLGASEVFAVDNDMERLRMAVRFGATTTIAADRDPVAKILNATGGRGVDVAVEALGSPETFENALRVLRPGGTLSSVGIYTGHLKLPLEAVGAGIAGKRIFTTMCPGGKARMARLMRLVATSRIDLTPLLTHLFSLDDIDKAYELFGARRDNVLKVAIRVS